MRYESAVLSVSWIPSDAIAGLTKVPFEMGVTHYDDPPPDDMRDFEALLAADRFRFANELRAWIEVVDDRIVDAGYSGGGHINVSKLRVGRRELSFAAVPLPDLQQPPEIGADSATFVQTAGGRTALPAPRRVHGRPFVQIAAPLAWTTLRLTIRKDGSSNGELVGASPFPRHWMYDASMALTAKTGLIDFEAWYREAFGRNTPWGDTDSPAFVTSVESALERALSRTIMQGDQRPAKRTLAKGDTLVRQGEPGGELFLLLDGVLAVEVDGEMVAEVGPGAILGERAVLEGGRRTATLRAVVPSRVVVVPGDALDPSALEGIREEHRRKR